MLVADAPPESIWVAVSTCFSSITTESFAGIDTASDNLVPSKERVKVPAVPAVFTTTMFVTTVVVDVGTVYSVVDTVVVAAPRNKVFDTVAISYYLQ